MVAENSARETRRRAYRGHVLTLCLGCVDGWVRNSYGQQSVQTPGETVLRPSPFFASTPCFEKLFVGVLGMTGRPAFASCEFRVTRGERVVRCLVRGEREPPRNPPQSIHGGFSLVFSGDMRRMMKLGLVLISVCWRV